MELNKYTSKDFELFDCISEFETITEQGRFLYQLSYDEVAWFDWIGDRYTIATTLKENWHEDDDGTVTIVIDTMDISAALSADDVDRPPCLSDDTQLARLVWFIGPN